MAPNPSQRKDEAAEIAPDPCSTPTDPKAPAGARNSLGSKSDCNSRPATDDSVVEAMDEMGPGLTPPAPERDARS